MHKTLVAILFGTSLAFGACAAYAQAPDLNSNANPLHQPAQAATEAAQAGNSPMLMNKLRDQLGSEWNIQKKGPQLEAVRSVPAQATSDLQQKVNQQIASAEQDKKGMTASFEADEVRLGGVVQSCGDVVDQAKNFAKIKGVNHIVIDTRCSAASH